MNNRHKFILLVVVLVAIVLVFGIYKFNDNNFIQTSNYIAEKINDDLNVQQLSIDLDTKEQYILTDKGLLRKSDNSYIIKNKYNRNDCLNINDDKIAIYSNNKLSIYDMQGALLNEVNIDGEDITKIRICKEKVYFTQWDTVSNYLKVLSYYDLNSESITQIQLPFLIYTFDVNTKEELFFAYEQEKEDVEEHLITVGYTDLSLGTPYQVEILYEFSPESSMYIEDMCYDGNNVYFCGDFGIGELELHNKTVKTIFDNRMRTVENIATKIIKIKDDLYINDRSFTYKISASNGVVLNIISENDYLHSSIVSAAKKLRDESKLDMVQCLVVDNINEKLKTKLFAKESDFDIMPLSFEEVQAIGTDYILPITDENYIDNIYANYFPSYKNITTNASKEILGVPHISMTEAFVISDASHLAFNKSELVNEINDWDWNEFLDLCLKYSKDINSDGKNDIWLTDWNEYDILEYLAKCYITQGCKDSDGFKKLLIKLKDTSEKGGLVKDDHIDTSNCILHNATLSLSNEELATKNKDEREYYLLPTINKKEPIYLIDGMMYCVNRFSKNPEVAQELLVDMMSPEYVIPVCGSTWYANQEWYNSYYSQYLRQNPNAQDARTNGMLLEMTPKLYDSFEKAYTHGTISKVRNAGEQYTMLLKSYLQEDIDEEAFINGLSEYR